MPRLTNAGWKLLYTLIILALAAIYFTIAMLACQPTDRSWGLSGNVRAYRSPEVPSSHAVDTTTGSTGPTGHP